MLFGRLSSCCEDEDADAESLPRCGDLRWDDGCGGNDAISSTSGVRGVRREEGEGDCPKEKVR